MRCRLYPLLIMEVIMKISEMTTSQAMEVMASMIPAVYRVFENKKVQEAMTVQEDPQGGGIKFFMTLAAVLFRECKRDAAEIVGILCGKTVEQVMQQNIVVTMKDVASCYDKELMDFFSSFKPKTQES